MKKTVSFLFILFLSISVLFAGGLPERGWVDLTGEKATNRAPEVKILDIRDDSIILEISIDGFMVSRESENGIEYLRISLPDTANLSEIGKAELPQFGRLLQLPFNSEYRIRIIDKETVTFEDVLIYPAQQKPARSNPGFKYPFSLDEDFYSRDGMYPADIANLGDSGIFRDIYISRLGIYPFQYDPGAGRLDVHKRIVIAVDIYHGRDSYLFKNNDISFTFHNLYSQLILNYGHNRRSGRIEAESILVLVSDPLDSAIAPLLEWKDSKGIKVYKVMMSEIQNTTAGIKAAIQNAYDTFTPKPSYVLLVGHSDTVVPNFRSTAYGSAASDYPYTLLEGDQYPDILIGRILAHNTDQVDVQVSKIVSYEQSPFLGTEGEFYSKAFGIASNEGSNPSDEQYIQYTAGYLQDGTYTHHDYFFQGSGNATAVNISAALSDGRTWTSYIGHGSGTSWGNTNTTFNVSTVHGLSNYHKLPILIDVACLNGQFDKISECFGEAWMWAGTPADPKGAVGYYGGSVSVSWDPPAIMMVGIAKHHFEDPVYTFGGSCLAGQMYLVAQNGWNSSTEDNFEWYNIFGDPSLMIRTDNPAIADVDHPPLIPAGSTSANVNVGTGKGPFEGALVCIYAQNNTDLYGSAFTDASGSATVNFDTAVLPTDDLYITVTGYNISTYQSSILAGSTSDGIVSLDRDIYSCSHTAYISLIDADLEGQGTQTVSLISTTNPIGINVILNETEIDGFFQGSVDLGVDIAVSHNDTLTVTYHDLDTGDGSAAYKTDTALIDCMGPEIYDISIVNTSGSSIVLGFETSKNAISLVNYGTDPGNLYMTANVSSSFRTSHSATIAGLAPDTTYHMQIVATDNLGNVTVGDIFSFTTPNILTIGDGSVEINEAPLYCYYHDNRTQIIYHSSDFGNTPLILSSIAIDVTTLPVMTLNNWTIRMKHTTKADYSGGASFEADNWTIVYQNNETISETGWVLFEFDETFFYDGSQNLMIDFSFNNSSWQSPYGKANWTAVPSSRAIHAHTDSTYGDPLTWSPSYAPTVYTKQNILNIKLALEDPDAPMPPSNFTASGVSENQIDLSWQKNTDNHDVIILWSYENLFGVPTNGFDYSVGAVIPGGGTVLYKGSDTAYSHISLNTATTYYYRAFSYDSSLEYSPGTGTNASTLCGIINLLPFSENFDASTELPMCWEIIDHQGNGQVWQIGTISSGLSGTTGNYAYLNSDGYGYGGTQNTDIVTPVLDLSGYYDVEVSFTHYFRQYSSASTATFAYSIDNGENWTNVQSWTSTTSNPVYFSQIIPAVSGQSMVRFKWHYTGSYGYYWCVDDILIDSENTEPHYSVTLYADPDNIGVNLSGAGDYVEGANVAISASRTRNYVFVEWTGSPEDIALLNDPESSSANFLMPARNVSFTAVFEAGPDDPAVPVFRFFNTVLGGHLYTISEIERDYIINNLPDWSYEGIKFYVHEFQTEDTTKTYRFFNTITGIHLYTISDEEYENVLQLPEWNYEGIKFYVFPNLSENTTAVYRFFNHVRGGHLYTISEVERDAVMQLPDWTYEGVPFYVIPDIR